MFWYKISRQPDGNVFDGNSILKGVMILRNFSLFFISFLITELSNSFKCTDETTWPLMVKQFQEVISVKCRRLMQFWGSDNRFSRENK